MQHFSEKLLCQKNHSAVAILAQGITRARFRTRSPRIGDRAGHMWMLWWRWRGPSSRQLRRSRRSFDRLNSRFVFGIPAARMAQQSRRQLSRSDRAAGPEDYSAATRKPALPRQRLLQRAVQRRDADQSQRRALPRRRSLRGAPSRKSRARPPWASHSRLRSSARQWRAFP